MLLSLLLFLALPSVQATPWEDSTPEDLQVSLVTALPGHRDPSAWYGHSGVLVEDAVRNETAYYGYLLDQVGSAWRAVRTGVGDSDFRLVQIPLEDVLADYGRQGREVQVLELRFSPDQAHALALDLAATAEAGRWEPYDSIQDNCSTRLRDLFDAALGGALRDATDVRRSEDPSLRTVTRDYLDHAPAAAVGMRFFLGGAGDRSLTAWDRMFLPLELDAAVASFQAPDGAGEETDRLGGERTVLLEPEETFTPAEAVRPAPWLLLGSLLAAAGLAAWALTQAHLRRTRDAVVVVLVVVGLALTPVSLLLLVLWGGTMGTHFAHNENLLLVPPTVVAYIPLGIRVLLRRYGAWPPLQATAMATAGLAVLALLNKGLPWSDQANWNGLALFVPLHVGLAVAAWASTRGHADPAPEDGPDGVRTA